MQPLPFTLKAADGTYAVRVTRDLPVFPATEDLYEIHDYRRNTVHYRRGTGTAVRAAVEELARTLAAH